MSRINWTKFVDPLPLPPRARSAESRPHPNNRRGLRIPFYRIEHESVCSKGPSRLAADAIRGDSTRWSPGPLIEARQGEPLLVEWINALPTGSLSSFGLYASWFRTGCAGRKNGGSSARGSCAERNPTAIRSIGLLQGNLRLCSIRTCRKQPCCGITTTRWRSRD